MTHEQWMEARMRLLIARRSGMGEAHALVRRGRNIRRWLDLGAAPFVSSLALHCVEPPPHVVDALYAAYTSTVPG